MKRALVVLALVGAAAAAPRHSSHRDRAFRNAKRECEQTACAARRAASGEHESSKVAWPL